MANNADGLSGRKPARLAIVDDHHLFRAGLWDALADEPDFEVIGEATDGREALELCCQARPDLVLMDLRMPRMNGLAATRAIKRNYPRIAVLMITIHEDLDYLLEALRVGVAGYILKDAAHEDMVSAIRGVLSGESPLAPELAAQLLRQLALKTQEATEASPKPEGAKLAHPLTPRELEVLEHLAQGKTNREIAKSFVISVGTVKNHVEHLIAKLGVSDRTQAVVRALDLGIIAFPQQ